MISKSNTVNFAKIIDYNYKKLEVTYWHKNIIWKFNHKLEKNYKKINKQNQMIYKLLGQLMIPI